MSEEEVEVVAHQIALEICEATAAQARQWVWPDDFTGDTIDRARCRAEIIVAALDKHRGDDMRRVGNISPQDRADRMAQGLIGLGLTPGREREELNQRLSWLSYRRAKEGG